MHTFDIRRIEPRDDTQMAAIIREVMTEHGASGAGFAMHDPEVDGMAKAYSQPGSAYFVIADASHIYGGGGIGPLQGESGGVCELRKMYFLPTVRGQGLGEQLLRRCLATAQELGYKTCYLETLASMQAARTLYEKMGFRKLCGPLGATGHFSCDSWYALDLPVAR